MIGDPFGQYETSAFNGLLEGVPEIIVETRLPNVGQPDEVDAAFVLLKNFFGKGDSPRRDLDEAAGDLIDRGGEPEERRAK